MDDDTLQVEFPLGPDTIIVSRPKPAALVALQLSRMPGRDDKEAVGRTVRRIFMFLEGVTSKDEYNKIDDGMLTGAHEVNDVLDLINDIVKFDWDAAENPAPTTLPTVQESVTDLFGIPRSAGGKDLDEARRAVAEAERLAAMTTLPEPARGPRVIGRG